MADPSDHVFVNCPFDKGFKPMFDAMVFAITDLGFVHVLRGKKMMVEISGSQRFNVSSNSASTASTTYLP